MQGNGLPRTTLEQWAALRAVVDEGSFARAAEVLNKSQSSISYALKVLQEQLPVPVLEQSGRRATLTDAGSVLLRRARALLDEAQRLEELAANLATGWEPEVRLAAEIIFPPELLLEALAAFAPASRSSRVQLIESVLGGTQEALLRREADLVIIHQIPPGFLGQPLLTVEFIAVAHPDHSLHQLGRVLTEHDLKGQRQIVIRDSGLRYKLDSGWLGSEQRWTVSNLATSVRTVASGLGFAWLPEHEVRPLLASGGLKELPLRELSRRRAELFLVVADRDGAGLAAQALATALVETCTAARQRQAR